MEKEEIVSVEEKIKMHPYWVGRALTKEEFSQVKSLPVKYKFKRGDKLGENIFFKRYRRMNCDGVDRENQESRDRTKLQRDSFWRKNKERLVKINAPYRLKWLDKNRQKATDAVNAYNKKKRATDPAFKIKTNMRSWAIRGVKMQKERHLERESIQFLLWLAKRNNVDYMTKRKWEIDHIHPLSNWNLLDEQQAKEANAPENLRWLTMNKNRVKWNKVPTWQEWIDHLHVVDEWRKEIAKNSQDLISQS